MACLLSLEDNSMVCEYFLLYLDIRQKRSSFDQFTNVELHNKTVSGRKQDSAVSPDSEKSCTTSTIKTKCQKMA